MNPNGSDFVRGEMQLWESKEIPAYQVRPIESVKMQSLMPKIWENEMRDWLASFDPDSFSWKMCQLSLFEGLTEFSWNSLRWGTIVGGRLYQPQSLGPRTCGNAGFFLPTPTASDYGANKGGGSGKEGKPERPSLSTMARKNLWRTPQARDGIARGPQSPEKRMAGGHSVGLGDQIGGPLNPEWVEWLMGYPLDWTALKGLETLWFRCKRVKPSKDLPDCKNG